MKVHLRSTMCVLALACFALPGSATSQATGQIQGQITDATSMAPLSDAQISLAGLGLGVISNNAGRFLIPNVPAGSHTLRAELIGYAAATRDVEVRPGEATTVSLSLRETAIAMDEMIVTGTPAATSRREIGNAIAQVNAAEIVEQAPIANVNELLTGRIPGAVVASQSGNLGAGAPIRLRGDNSLSLGGQPIIYVDGVRVDGDADAGGLFGHTGSSRLSDFNPNDIESVEILKGPAAATLYGTEASNGVIQIITKKGRPGSTVISLKVEQGATWLRNPSERIPENCGREDGQLICQNLVLDERAAGRDIFRTGHLQSYDLSIRGGEGNIGYFISGEFGDSEGMYFNNSLTRQAYRANVNAQLTDDLMVGANLGYVTSDNPRAADGFSGDQGIIPNMLFATPRARDTDTRGFLRGPPEESNEIETQENINRFTFSFQASHDPFDWLAHRLNAGVDVVDAHNFELWTRQPEGSAHFFGSRGLGQKEVEDLESRHVTLDYAATGTVDVSSDLRSATSVGAQYFTTERSRTYAFGREFPSPEVTTVSAAAVTSSAESFVENSTVGVYVQERLAWRERLFLTGAVRADDNSAFGKDFDVVVYPKVSGSWTVSSEPFFNVGFINDLSLRAAWGKAGQQPSAFAAVRTFSPFTGEGDGAGFLPNNPGNPELKPETGTELEMGFDAAMLNGRLGMSFTWYDQTKEDVIVNQDVPPSTGFSGSQTVNLGRIDNWGMELELNADPVLTSNLQLRLGGSIAYNQNEIVELGGPPINAGGFGTIQHREGFPLGSFFAKKVVSATRQPDGTFTNVMCDGGTGEQGLMPGGAAVDCSDAPAVMRGQPGPRWSGSFNAGLVLFNNLRLAAATDVRLDQHQFSITAYGRDAVFRNSRKINDPTEADWNDLAEWEAVSSPGPFVQNHSYAALREISATYSLPGTLTGRLGADRASLRAAVRNVGYLWVHESFTDVDPDIQRGGSTIEKSQQTLSPQPTRFVISLDFTF